ncbi:helix-turn-helix domain-containing protein [Natronoarchaeum rubrum]|uniref:helix-turn-helix domain-containing protein n=1 Tax=Natronoarchaeum rubrum TaxID=755311 RepID=UPI00211363DD|nr:bacterio-opsin activator domain-containing protein [Natronoarchaeum rubrum]
MTVNERRPAPEGVTRVEFGISNPKYPFVGASAGENCQLYLEEILPRGEGSYAEFFAVVGADPDRIVDLADEHASAEPTLLNEYDSGGLFEFHVADECPAVFLSELGALPRRVYSDEGEGHISVEIPPAEDACEIVDAFLDAHPGAELERKSDQPYVTPMFSHRKFRNALEDRLTARQEEVLAAAHESGYYDWPREITAEELADRQGISTSTLLKHLRAVERKFIAAFFERPADGPSRTAAAAESS